MAWERIATQSEVIRAIMLEGSPCCEVPAPSTPSRAPLRPNTRNPNSAHQLIQTIQRGQHTDLEPLGSAPRRAATVRSHRASPYSRQACLARP